jgi:hypothetical protein
VSLSLISIAPDLTGLAALSSDPFAEEGDPLGGNQDVGSTQNYLHIRIQQRNGRKTLTTLQGLPKGESTSAYQGCTRLSIGLQNMIPRNS